MQIFSLRLKLWLMITSIVAVIPLLSIQSQDQTRDTNAIIDKKWGFEIYGNINYYNFDWESLPKKRNAVDLEKFSIEANRTWQNFTFETEIEFEHGGTGSTMDFDPLEEFGEFETEIEKGGEIILEKLSIAWDLAPNKTLTIGKQTLNFGINGLRDEPTEYLTVNRSESESTLLPSTWNEIGVNFTQKVALNNHSKYPMLELHTGLFTGLDNTGFNAYNWIKSGYQKRFETINANAFAGLVALKYKMNAVSEIACSFYANNPTDNRPKQDLKSDSWLHLAEAHILYSKHPWRFSVFGMYGNIQNSNALSTANRNLSNQLNVKRTPVGKNGIGTFVELGYDILNLTKSQSQLYLFGRYDYYDSQYKTTGEVIDNPRYERKVITLGINYFPKPYFVLKAQFSHRKLGNGLMENTFMLGTGFEFYQ